ncbi:phage tail family protein [Curtobacterium flaccumfaciens]|uniref:phage tail family protein n=1 Tax=Curtobacterium flaccumfaciens TaxID=2035 RepID=UPI0022021D5E|nr:phage tail family protein [Curtobacterium flaccumfaciens]UWD83662.1 phage tail family protein [Curtobacterium flaccumfaciens]
MPGPWRLIYPGQDVIFTDESGIYLRKHPEVADYDIAIDDADNVRGDGSQVGQDFHGGRTIGLTFGVLGRTEAELRKRASILAGLWDAASVRSRPGELAELVSDAGRSAFGRPRKIAPSDVFPEANMQTVEAQFRQVDKLWYGPEDSLEVPLALTQGGGLVSPLKSPLVARGSTSAANVFVVEGEQPTWPVITIRGPISNATVEVAGLFRFTAASSLRYDEWLTIDTRPGQRSVTRNGSRIGSLTRSSSLLPSAALPPGSHTLTLSGSSASGTPSAQIIWRAAYSTP